MARNANARRDRLEQLQALGRLMGDPAGRRWVYNLLGEFHVWDTSYATNALRMAFLEGERNAGLRFQSEVEEANQEMFYQMLKERKNERPGDDDSRSNAGGDPFYDSIADAPDAAGADGAER